MIDASSGQKGLSGELQEQCCKQTGFNLQTFNVLRTRHGKAMLKPFSLQAQSCFDGVMACGGDEQLNRCPGAVVEDVCHLARKLPRARPSVGYPAASHGRLARGPLRCPEDQQRRRDIKLSLRPVCHRGVSELRELHTFLAWHGSHLADCRVGAQVIGRYKNLKETGQV